MKNIKISVFCVMTIVTVTDCYKPMHVAAVEKVDTVLAKHFPKLAAIIASFGDTIDAHGKAINNLSASVAGATDKGSMVGQQMVVVAGAGVLVHGVTQLYPIGKEVASYIFPSEEEKRLKVLRCESAQQTLELLQAEGAFRQCIIKNRLNSDRGISGLPRVCENAAEIFALLGNRSEVDQTIAYFNKMRK